MFQAGKYSAVLGTSLVNKKCDTEVQFLKRKLVLGTSDIQHLVSVLVAVKCTKNGQVDKKRE